MGLLDLFTKKENLGAGKTIGSFECDSENLSNMVIGLLNKMGMTSSTLTTISGKSVKIVKLSETKYKVTLLAYNPPVDVIWYNPINVNNLEKFLKFIEEENKQLAYINQYKSNNGMQMQFALLA